MKIACFAVAGSWAVAGFALAAPFQPLNVDAGGDLLGYDGPGFRVDNGGFFVADGAGTGVFVGNAAAFSALNEFEFDSHFTIDQHGPTARNRTTNPANNSIATLSFYGDYGPASGLAADYNEGELIPGSFHDAGPGSHIGDPDGNGDQPENAAEGGYAVIPPFVQSGFAPNQSGGRSAFDGVFIARLTIKAGSTLSGGVFFALLTEPANSDAHTILLGGPAVMFQTSPTEQQALALRAYLVTTVDLQTPSAATASGVNDETPFGMADVYDLWVQTVPAGATVCFAVPFIAMGLARRRFGRGNETR